MADYADLEISLYRRDADGYAVQLRHSPPGSDADIDPLRGELALARFDFSALREQELDSVGYGRLLSTSVFADPALRQALAAARASADTDGVPLRLRLAVSRAESELHSLRWETLRDPEGDTPLLLGERILFSRYLSSGDWRKVLPRAEGDLRALVAIADPTDLAGYAPAGRPLAPLDVAGERARAATGLAGIPLTDLASSGATLTNLIAELQNGYDVLYLVCHGAVIDGEPRLWLVDEAGRADVVDGQELVRRVYELLRPPRLVVLISCRSSGPARAGEGAALAALGPRLAAAGVPAVLAMQGDVSVSTMAAFLPVFFAELRQDGQIDRALAVARGAVRERHDWWMPVLFMRLKSGSLWYKPGFADDPNGFEKWPAVLRSIDQGRCVPILGPGLHEPLTGSRREIALRWAETYGFPMAIHERDDLPQVAQYLAVKQDEEYLSSELVEYLRQETMRRYHAELADEPPDAPLVDLLARVGQLRREADPAEAHRVLAELNFPLYITTTPGDLLLGALRAAGKKPRRVVCHWNTGPAEPAAMVADDADAPLGVERPLVFHAFGHLDDPDSLVLTEDNYFDYLIKVTLGWSAIPSEVRLALSNNALLFLGFQMDDWNFRTLFRLIRSQAGGSRRRRHTHVAVQVAPDEDQIQSPERARRYLEQYFQGADITVYWGSAEDFARALRQKRPASAAVGEHAVFPA
jgi:hypothetical protein